MIHDRQKKFIKLGDFSCYLLCLVEYAQRIRGVHFDVENLYDTFVLNKWIDEDCFVQEPTKILSHLIPGSSWTMRKTDDTSYKPGYNEFIVQRWEWARTGITTAHFCLPDYDPLGLAETREHGKIVSLRVFTRV